MFEKLQLVVCACFHMKCKRESVYMARLLSIEYPGFEKLNFFGGTTRRIHLGFDTAADVMYLNKAAYKKLTNIVSYLCLLNVS